jgi:hypothetical protein
VENDLINLKKYSVYTKLLIDGMPSPIFSANTLSPNKKDEKEFETRYQKVLAVNREKYCKSRDKVVASIEKTMADLEKAENDLVKKKEEKIKEKKYK